MALKIGKIMHISVLTENFVHCPLPVWAGQPPVLHEIH